MIGTNAKRIKKMNDVMGIMESMYPVTRIDGEPVRPEVVAAVDMGAETGFTVAKLVAEGKCDEMDPLEIAANIYRTAFDLYAEYSLRAGDGKGAEHGREQE